MWLNEVLRALSIDRVALAGVSLGCWVALDYATQRPGRVERVAVLCPGGVGRQKIAIVFATIALRMCGAWGKRELAERIVGRPPVDQPPAVKAFLNLVSLKWDTGSPVNRQNPRVLEPGCMLMRLAGTLR